MPQGRGPLVLEEIGSGASECRIESLRVLSGYRRYPRYKWVNLSIMGRIQIFQDRPKILSPGSRPEAVGQVQSG